jgi:glycosyltransferase involved in cell wall biosynthesis|tara:strand:+ start:758 stop:1588 length:831 start_codon:yes stop_codon:yes gene_type:complete
MYSSDKDFIAKESDHRKLNPAVSVVMSIYNGENFIERSIESISKQTYSNYEIVIVDDGSTDKSSLILDKLLNGNHIDLLIRNNLNIGLTKSLNIGVALSNGFLIARQDVDDISYKNRLLVQTKFIDDYDLIGGLAATVYANNMKKIIFGEKENSKNIMEMVFLENPFVHSSVMFRKEVFNRLGGYNEDFKVSQDFELWMRFAEVGKIGKMNTVVVERMVHDQMISRKASLKQLYYSNKARFMHPHTGYIKPIIYGFKQMSAFFVPRFIKEIIKKLL